MISFRLSNAEYVRLMDMCLATDTRSISELARKAMQHWLEHGGTVSNDELHGKLMQLEQRVAELTAQLEGVSRAYAGR